MLARTLKCVRDGGDVGQGLGDLLGIFAGAMGKVEHSSSTQEDQ